jgi:thiol-disulfide isomerase/thioredoxin
MAMSIRRRDSIDRAVRLLAVLACVTTGIARAEDDAVPAEGPWRAWLDSPGGALPFELQFERQGTGWHVLIINGRERIPVPVVKVGENEVILGIDYYDSQITARLAPDGRRLDGTWRKKARGAEWTQMEFHATAGRQPRFIVDHETATYRRGLLDGQWRVDFSSSDQPAVGLFEARPDHTATGTFMTPTGDYRYLAGTFDGRDLKLSTFDGAHAFLFKAEMKPGGTLAGDFWSRDKWHETWTARRANGSTLPDPFAMTEAVGPVRLADLKLPDVDGTLRSLAEPEFAGDAMIIEIFGTWCPNCHDATEYLVELERRYGDRGLAIVALAFELTGDFKRDARLVQTYAKRHEVTYPILIAGLADKDRVASVVPFIDRLRSYPTTIFLTADGEIRAIHTGFAGPATGVNHLSQKAKFEAIIESMLTE